MSGVSNSSQAEQRNQDATIYVGGLDERVDEDLLWELFVQVGPLTNVFIPTDKVTNRHSNYAFVEFKNEEDAEYAVNVLNMVRLYGKCLRLSRAGSLSAGGKGEKTAVLKDVGANLFVGSLSQEVDEKMLFDTFSAFGAIIRQPKIVRDEQSKESKGFGFVNFDSFEAADAAIEAMSGQSLGGRQITIMYAFRVDNKTERHGSQAERLLAAASRSKPSLKPNTLFATAPGQIVSSVPLTGQSMTGDLMQQQQPSPSVPFGGLTMGLPTQQQMQEMMQMMQMQQMQQMQQQMHLQQMSGFMSMPMPPPLPPGFMPPPLPNMGMFQPPPLPSPNFFIPPPPPLPHHR
jgi:splicing factor 3B subunit 4